MFDNKDSLNVITDVIRYCINDVLSSVRLTMRSIGKELMKQAAIYGRLAYSFGDLGKPYHKTKFFRLKMYYRRYERNSKKSNKRRKKR